MNNVKYNYIMKKVITIMGILLSLYGFWKLSIDLSDYFGLGNYEENIT